MERMTEIMAFIKEIDYKNRMLLISTNIKLDSQSMINFMKYWKNEKQQLELQVENFSNEERSELASISRLQTEFKNNIDTIIKELSQFANISNEELAKNNYDSIIQQVQKIPTQND